MAFVLVTHDEGSTNTSSATTPGVDTTGATLIVVAVVDYQVPIGTFSDSKGNTWTALTQRGGGGNRVRLYYAAGAPTVGAAHTFTATTANGFPGIAMVAFSGEAASPFDAETGATATQPGSITPAEANELLVTALCYYPSQTPTVDSGFSTPYVKDYAAPNLGAALSYLIETTATATNPTWGGSFGEQATAMAAFKAAAGGGGGGVIAQHYYPRLLGGIGGPF